MCMPTAVHKLWLGVLGLVHGAAVSVQLFANPTRPPTKPANSANAVLCLGPYVQEVVDITPTLRNLLGYADGTHLSNILRTRRPLLTRAWLETLGVCGRRSNTPKLDLTESGIAAPVTEFVSGCGCRLKPGQYQVRAAVVGRGWE